MSANRGRTRKANPPGTGREGGTDTAELSGSMLKGSKKRQSKLIYQLVEVEKENLNGVCREMRKGKKRQAAMV